MVLSARYREIEITEDVNAHVHDKFVELSEGEETGEDGDGMDINPERHILDRGQKRVRSRVNLYESPEQQSHKKKKKKTTKEKEETKRKEEGHSEKAEEKEEKEEEAEEGRERRMVKKKYGEVYFSVSDEGVGIAEHAKHKVH